MEHLLFLHGAIGAKDQLQSLANTLSTSFTVHLLNFSGHGGSAGNESFHIATFANEVEHWLTENRIDKVNIFGYSMGGYVAMYLARHHPKKIGRIITLATKFNWTKEVAAKEVKLLQPDVIETKLPQFANQLQQRHGHSNWKDVLAKTATMLLEMGYEPPLKDDDVAAISPEVLLLLGDRDKMVTLDETMNVFQTLPTAQLAVLPNTSHPIEAVDQEYLAFLIRKFFN